MALLPITDVAVPLFFAVSGYFVFNSKRSWRRISRIGFIFFWSALLYFSKTELYQLVVEHEIYVPSWKNVIDFFIFNDVAFSIHLWYLPAYVYVLTIAYFIDKYGFWKYAFLAILPLLIMGVFIKNHIADVCPENIHYYRNAFFNGLPYFLLGALVNHYLVLFVKRRIPVCLLLVIVFLLFIMRYFLTGISFQGLLLRELNLLFLTFFIMVFITLSRQENDNVISMLGRNYSLYVYICHILVMLICEAIANSLPDRFSSVYFYFNPFIVVLISLFSTFILGKLKIIKL